MARADRDTTNHAMLGIAIAICRGVALLSMGRTTPGHSGHSAAALHGASFVLRAALAAPSFVPIGAELPCFNADASRRSNAGVGPPAAENKRGRGGASLSSLGRKTALQILGGGTDVRLWRRTGGDGGGRRKTTEDDGRPTDDGRRR